MRAVVCTLVVALLMGTAVADPRAPVAPANAPSAEVAPSEDERPVRRRDVTVARIFRGPFSASHVFAMPTADVVGAYQLSIAGDGSLVSETGAFSGTGVAAIGFGDVAQLEYRLSSAFSNLGQSDITLPSLGVQFKLPLRERKYLPAWALALRLGLPRIDELGDGTERESLEQKVNDLYVVGRLKLWGPLHRFTLHGGLRVGAATLDRAGAETKRTLFLPAAAWEVQMNPHTRLAGELSLVPVFAPGANGEIDHITSKPFGRLGIRWAIHPAFVMDASVGYRIEVARFDMGEAGGLDELIGWDIRLGGELFVPWGALICRAGGVFCD